MCDVELPKSFSPVLHILIEAYNSRDTSIASTKSAKAAKATSGGIAVGDIAKHPACKGIAMSQILSGLQQLLDGNFIDVI